MAVTGVVLRPAGAAFKAVPVALLAVGNKAGAAVGSGCKSLLAAPAALTVLGAGISTEIESALGPGGVAAEVASIGSAFVPGAAGGFARFFVKRLGAGWGSARVA